MGLLSSVVACSFVGALVGGSSSGTGSSISGGIVFTPRSTNSNNHVDAAVGRRVGVPVGPFVGASVGPVEGTPVGNPVGVSDGRFEGDPVGNSVGVSEGTTLGETDGDPEGVIVGKVVGI